jgi:hypothetical protein
VHRLRERARVVRTEWRPILAALPAVVVTRLVLTVAPYRLWRGRLTAALTADDRADDAESRDIAEARRICRSVARAARLVPGATCLTQGLAAHRLLARAGIPSRLRVGVRHGGGAELHAHAWVTSRGMTVLGGAAETPFRAAIPAARVASQPFVRRESSHECTPQA